MITDKMLSYYNFNINKDMIDIIGNNNGIMSNFNHPAINYDEFGSYITFDNLKSSIFLPISINNIAGYIYTIKLKDLSHDDQSIISTPNLYHYVYNHYYFETLTKPENPIITDLSKQDIENKVFTVYIDMINDILYINNKKYTNKIKTQTSYDKFNGVILGYQYYNSFIGNLYNFSVLKEPLTDTEIDYVFKNNNSFFDKYYILEYDSKLRSLGYNNTTQELKELNIDIDDNIINSSFSNPNNILQKNIKIANLQVSPVDIINDKFKLLIYNKI